MFDIEAAKRELGIETKRMEFEEYPRAKRANRAKKDEKFSHFSRFSTPQPPEIERASNRKACFWQYKLDAQKPGFIQMGLMTNDPVEAQRQLTKIYDKPVIGLRKK